jgi:predicted dehydrogenase
MKRTLSRRHFLQQMAITAGAMSVPLPIASSALGKDSSTAPSNTITMGCIGVGGMGTGDMKVFLGLPECRVVAVCDTFEKKRTAAKERVDMQYSDKGCTTYADWREVIARKDIDALLIAPQDHWHALIATAAAKAGKDMYCEKPLGVAVAESQAIRNAVRDHKRVFQTGTWQRSLGNFQHACRLVRNGYIGKVHTVEVGSPCPKYRPKYKGSLDPQPVPAGFDWAMWRGPAPDKPYNEGRVMYPDWYLIWDYCAGFMANWGVHHLDIANWACPEIGNEPFDLQCKGVYRHEGFSNNIDTWEATFTYASGFKVSYTDDYRQKTGCKFIGDKGWVYIDRSGIAAEPDSLLKVQIKPEEEQLTDSKHHGDNFLQCIRTRKDPVSIVYASHTATVLGLITDIAARLEKKLHWDPKAEQFVGCDEANKMLTRPMYNGWSL